MDRARHGIRYTAKTENAETHLDMSGSFAKHIHLFRGASLVVFIHLVLVSDENGVCDQTYEDIEQATGYSRKAVSSALKLLFQLQIDNEYLLSKWRIRDEVTGRYVGSNKYLLFPTQREVEQCEAGLFVGRATIINSTEIAPPYPKDTVDSTEIAPQYPKDTVDKSAENGAIYGQDSTENAPQYLLDTLEGWILPDNILNTNTLPNKKTSTTTKKRRKAVKETNGHLQPTPEFGNDIEHERLLEAQLKKKYEAIVTKFLGYTEETKDTIPKAEVFAIRAIAQKIMLNKRVYTFKMLAGFGDWWWTDFRRSNNIYPSTGNLMRMLSQYHQWRTANPQGTKPKEEATDGIDWGSVKFLGG